MKLTLGQAKKLMEYSVGNLHLDGSKVTALPDNLEVPGILDLSNSEIVVLPKRLRVGGDLDLTGTAITTLPEDLYVGGKIYPEHLRRAAE